MAHEQNRQWAIRTYLVLGSPRWQTAAWRIRSGDRADAREIPGLPAMLGWLWFTVRPLRSAPGSAAGSVVAGAVALRDYICPKHALPGNSPTLWRLTGRLGGHRGLLTGFAFIWRLAVDGNVAVRRAFPYAFAVLRAPGNSPPPHWMARCDIGIQAARVTRYSRRRRHRRRQVDPRCPVGRLVAFR
jgi:hypothetical protein